MGGEGGWLVVLVVVRLKKPGGARLGHASTELRLFRPSARHMIAVLGLAGRELMSSPHQSRELLRMPGGECVVTD